jgi:hypothetical protein
LRKSFIFFEVLSGRRPYSSAGEGEGTHVDHPPPERPGVVPPPSVRALNSEVPSALDRICRRAIAQDPRDRYPSARALADDLDLWLLAHRGGKVKLSFAITTVILGLAAALLLVIALRTTLFPWRDGVERSPAGGSPGAPGSAGSFRIVGGSTASRPPGQGEVTKDVQLIGNTRKGLYHLSTCVDIQNMSEHNRVILKDATQAAAQGLRPCAHCRPPVATAPAKVHEGE